MIKSAPVSSSRANKSKFSPPNPLEHVLYALVEFLLLVCFLIVLGDSIAPQRLELSAFDRATLGQVLNKRVEHRMIIQPARCLAMNEVDNKLQPFLRAVQARFERADTFEEMFFQRRPEETFDPPIRRRGRVLVIIRRRAPHDAQVSRL